ncbi:MAG TPA: hypothetical protein VGM34_00060 [Chlamydiales bacterium]|jgi:hypothetical protein
MRLALFFLFLMTSISGWSDGKPKLTDYKKNVFSQWGEDGIIEKIFETIGTTSKTAIEFGAHDGFLFSNTANLWTKDLGWNCILIESDASIFGTLVSNVSRYSCTPLLRTVGIHPHNSLETILKEVNLKMPVDILSIDVDGDDYYLLQSIQYLKPRLIICEYNPSIPAHLDVYSDYGNHIGCSVAALQRIAAEKGYSLVAITDTNCFFVLNEEFPKFAKFETDREHIRINRWITYVISDYRGQYKLIGADNFAEPWGWAQNPSPEVCHGNITQLPGSVQKPRTRQ